MNWERACARANDLASEGHRVLVVDTISMPPDHLDKRSNITVLSPSEGEDLIQLLPTAAEFDAIIFVTPARPWCPRQG